MSKVPERFVGHNDLTKNHNRDSSLNHYDSIGRLGIRLHSFQEPS
jgi:hypothetical protein